MQGSKRLLASLLIISGSASAFFSPAAHLLTPPPSSKIGYSGGRVAASSRALSTYMNLFSDALSGAMRGGGRSAMSAPWKGEGGGGKLLKGGVPSWDQLREEVSKT